MVMLSTPEKHIDMPIEPKQLLWPILDVNFYSALVTLKVEELATSVAYHMY